MLNPFIYNVIEADSLSRPDIDVPLVQHFAQCAEDIVVVALLRSIAEKRGLDLKTERYLEIGANHPIATSATYLLHRELGMTGVLVEANPALIAELTKARPGDVVLHCAVVPGMDESIPLFISNQSELTSLSREFVEQWAGGTVGVKKIETVSAKRLNDVLREQFADKAPIYMSIDVEGLDRELLEDLDWSRWRPAIVQVEPSDQFQPGNARRIAGFLSTVGYSEIARTPVNQIFVDVRSFLSRPSVQLHDQSSADREDAGCGQPSVGVVLRTRDRPVLLRRALESVRDQTYNNWFLVVVNDGGDPAPVDWLVQSIFAGDPRINVVHHQEPVGMDAAANAGLIQLDTIFAVLHDDDDSWAPEFLSLLVATHGRQKRLFPSIRGVVSRIQLVHETVHGNEISIDWIEPFKPFHSDSLDEGLLSIQRILVRDQFPDIAFLFELHAAREIGFFDASYPGMGSWDFHTRFLLKHDVWVYAEYLSFHHRRPSARGPLRNASLVTGASARSQEVRLRNERVRATVKSEPSNLMLLTTSMEVQETCRNEFGHVTWRLWQFENSDRSPSAVKRMLVRVWESLPRFVQDIIEPLANFIDRTVK